MRPLVPAGIFNRRHLSKKAVLLILVLIVAATGFFAYRYYRNKHQEVNTSINANDSILNSHKNSDSPEDKRVVISAYGAKGDYQSALAVAQELAKQTKSYEDYMGVLLICGVHDVQNKQECVKNTAASLRPFASQMPYSSAYSAGAVLEKNNLKKEAIDFYQRAYDTYTTPDPNAENMMTKEQLKTRIDELRK